MAEAVIRGDWHWSGPNATTVINPWDGSAVDNVPAVSVEDLRLSLDWAAEHAVSCVDWPLDDRIRTVRAWADRIEAQAEQIALTETMEMGKPIQQSRAVMNGVVARLRSFAAATESVAGIVLSTDARASTANAFVTSVREPLGVVVGFLPFNSPVSSLVWKLAPALLMGNASVIKPSSLAPIAAMRTAAILGELGVPDAAVQIACGDGRSLAATVATHPSVRRISLTGGTEAGSEIWARTASTMPRLTLECGSSDAALILPDADIQLAVRTVVEFAFERYSGQLCTAPKRCIVVGDRFDAFVEALVAEAARLEPGDPRDESTAMGPLVSQDAAATVHEQVGVAAGSGARVLVGGQRLGRAGYAPTVVVDVEPSNPIYRDVPFGPVVTVSRARHEDEAVRLANDSPYGIRATVFGKDVARAVRVARRLDTGGVAINGTASVASDPQLATAPRKLSGVGAEGVLASLLEYSQSKFLWVHDFWTEADHGST